MNIQCPECKSDNIKTRSRRGYFIKLAVCLAIISLGCLEINSLKNEDVDAVVIIGVYGSLILICLSIIIGLYSLVRGILTKEISYKCKYCKNKFKVPFSPTHISST